MATRSVTTQTTARVKPDRFEPGVVKPQNPAAGEKSAHTKTPQRMVAVFLNPACEHDWFRLADDRQTLAAEGKTIWQCRSCAEITNTYDWQKP